MSRQEAPKSGTAKLPSRAIAAAAAVLAVVILLVVVEGVNSNRYSIRNDTGTDIEYITAYFENEGESFEYATGSLFEQSIPAGEKVTGSFEKLDSPYLAGSWLVVRVKFAGRDAVQRYAGYFTAAFNGKLKLAFRDDTETGGEIELEIKAGEGLFQSTKRTSCDEIQDLFDLDEID